MLKMFTTQLSGLFKKITEQNEFAFEDGARLLAQAVVGSGAIHICGTGEMAAVAFEALEGAEPLLRAKKWSGFANVTPSDRVILLSRFSDDKDALELAKELAQRNIPFVAVCTVVEGDGQELSELADVVIDLKLERGLLPDENGNRIGYPGAIAALFAYHGLKFTLEEILEDYE
jgi:uncharacterized phosphosugar-binding protein